MKSISMKAIGIVHSSRKTVSDDNWDTETAHITLDPQQFLPDALAGLGSFSHVEILFYMDQVEPAKIETASRHPRNNKAWPMVGIFAQRGKNRPNQIASTICKIKSVSGRELHVDGLDAIDGTPVLDIKPWVQEFAPRGATHQPAWMTELMQGYWKQTVD